MHGSTPLLPRLLALALAVVVLVAAAGCASDDDSASAPPATTAAQPAAPQQADPSALDAADNGTLLTVRRTVAAYCAGHKATAGELTGAIATLESLYEIDPEAKQPNGTTVEQAAAALERKLRACGARKPAKRLAKLTG